MKILNIILCIILLISAKKGIPMVIVGFSVLYWAYGLYFYINPGI